MADSRREWFRAAVVLAVVVVSLVEVLSQIQAVRSHRRLQAQALRAVKAGIEAELPRLTTLLAAGTVESWNQALDLAFEKALASEGEVLEVESGRSLFSRPTLMPVAPRPEEARAALRSREVTTSLVQTGPEIRAVTSIPFVWARRPSVLRLGTPVPDVAEDRRQRQQLLLAHLLAISVLLLAAALALIPRRPPTPEAAPAALDAYEQALLRLRHQDEARSQAHETALRRMGEEIKDKEAMARAGELTAGIVHEVRNGLGTILGYARFIERRPEAAEAVSAAAHIREECETLEAVVRRFMDFVKRETLNLDSFDLVRMMRRVAARESRSHEGAEVVLARVPDALSLVGDEELLERAFENLVRNAREAAGERGAVAVSVETDSDRAIVSVADDGPGLLPERRADLRPFFSTKPGGLGLGLPIAYKIVHLHEGALVLEDRVPRGLDVRVSLPLAGPHP